MLNHFFNFKQTDLSKGLIINIINQFCLTQRCTQRLQATLFIIHPAILQGVFKISNQFSKRKPFFTKSIFDVLLCIDEFKFFYANLFDNESRKIELARMLGGLDVTVRRNAFGRQVDSFESDIEFNDGSEQLVRAVFIRAPWVEKVSNEVQVLAAINAHPVAVRSKTALATSFHPEITGDNRIHRYFIEQVARPALQKVK